MRFFFTDYLSSFNIYRASLLVLFSTQKFIAGGVIFINNMEVVEVISATPDLCKSIGALVPQLLQNVSMDPPEVTSRIKSLIDSSATTLFAVFHYNKDDANEPRELLGVAVLVLFPTIGSGSSGSGFVKARIEDVVVDAAHRKKGVGQMLMEACIAKATAAGAESVDLTSNPRREAAHRLYERNEFVYYDTKVYRKQLR